MIHMPGLPNKFLACKESNLMLEEKIYIKNDILDIQMDVSENSGTPKSSILIGFSITNHPFWGTPIFGNTQIHVDSRCLKNHKTTFRGSAFEASNKHLQYLYPVFEGVFLDV